MRRTKTSVRMGPISLVTLVIVLCVSVMTVLAVSTGQAAYSAAQRQATSTNDIYACEQAGQEFLANVDAVLYEVRSNDNVSRSSALSALREAGTGLLDDISAEGISSAVEITNSTAESAETDGDTSYGADGLGSDGLEEGELPDAAESNGEATESNSAATEEIIDSETGLSTTSAEEAAEPEATGGEIAVSATFVTQSSRRLSITLAVDSDANYRILSWKTTTFWNNNTSTDTLWSGATTD